MNKNVMRHAQVLDDDIITLLTPVDGHLFIQHYHHHLSTRTSEWL